MNGVTPTKVKTHRSRKFDFRCDYIMNGNPTQTEKENRTMKFTFNIRQKGFTNTDTMARFEIMEFVALTNDSRILNFLVSFITLQEKKPGVARRKRTKEERIQRAEFYGFESFKDVAE